MAGSLGTRIADPPPRKLTIVGRGACRGGPHHPTDMQARGQHASRNCRSGRRAGLERAPTAGPPVREASTPTRPRSTAGVNALKSRCTPRTSVSRRAPTIRARGPDASPNVVQTDPEVSGYATCRPRTLARTAGDTPAQRAGSANGRCARYIWFIGGRCDRRRHDAGGDDAPAHPQRRRRPLPTNGPRNQRHLSPEPSTRPKRASPGSAKSSPAAAQQVTIRDVQPASPRDAYT